LGVVLYNIAISPFGKVRFSEYILCSSMGSIAASLVDVGLIWTYFIDGNWKD